MRSTGVKPVSGSLMFIVAIFLWLLVGLTLLGPYVGAMFSQTFNGPTRLLDLDYPYFEDLETALRATVPNADQRAHTFDVTFTVTGDSGQFSTLCHSAVIIQPGRFETVTCALNPVETLGDARYVVVTAMSSEEGFGGYCETPCLYSSRSACYVASFNEKVSNFFGISLFGLALIGVAPRLLRRVHRFMRPILLALWLLIWLLFTLLSYSFAPAYLFVMAFLIPSAALVTGWILRLWQRRARVALR